MAHEIIIPLNSSNVPNLRRNFDFVCKSPENLQNAVPPRYPLCCRRWLIVVAVIRVPWGDDMGEGSRCEVDDLIHLKVGKSKIARARLAKRDNSENWSAFKNDTKVSTLDTNTNGKIDPNSDALSKEMIEKAPLLCSVSGGSG